MNSSLQISHTHDNKASRRIERKIYKIKLEVLAYIVNAVIEKKKQRQKEIIIILIILDDEIFYIKYPKESTDNFQQLWEGITSLLNTFFLLIQRKINKISLQQQADKNIIIKYIIYITEI